MVLERFYEAAAIPAVWPEALDGLARMMGARGAMITSPLHTSGVYSPGLNGSVAAFFEGKWESRHTRTSAATRLGAAGFVCDQDILSFEEIRRSAYYNILAIPAEVPWFAACSLGEEGGPRVGLSLQRTARQGPFSAEEIARLNSIVPRLKHIRSTACRLAASENRNLLGALGTFGDAVILLGLGGVELDCNAAAERLFGDGLRRETGGGIGAEDPAARQRLRKLIDDVCADGLAPAQTVLASRRDGSVLKIQAAPVVGRARDLFGKARAFLTVSYEGSPFESDEAALRQRFQLTATEAKVAAQLVVGRSVVEIASAMGISPGGVRFHLKSILPKAGVHRQAEFVALMATPRDAHRVAVAAGLS